MSIVPSATILSYTGESSYSTPLQTIHEGVEQIIVSRTGKTFVSNSYANELYDGNGGRRLKLTHQPVTAVSRVCVDIEDVIQIKNTLTDATTASVVVDATNVTLTVDGGTGNSTSTLAIGTYTTLSILVTAINALSSIYGWSAQIYNTIFNDKKTNKLIAQQIDCTSFESVQQWSYLQMGEPVSFKVVDQKWIEAYFPRGSQNIAVSYTAGSAKADITMLVCILVKAIWSQKSNNAEGLKSFGTGDINMVYDSFANSPLMADIISDNQDATL